MEISRGYNPLFKTTVKGLAKVKLEPREHLSIEEIHRLIAFSALKSNDGFLDYKMLLYDDAIRFEKNEDESSFPEIPFASILHLIVLPNFSDVCFIQFRRSTYGMYVILRFKKANYISKVAKYICTWSDANASDTEESVNSSSETPSSKNSKGLQSDKKKGNQPPVIVHRLNHDANGRKSKNPRPSRGNVAKNQKTEGTQTSVKMSTSNKATGVGHSKLIHTKNSSPIEVRAATAIKKRNHSQPTPKKLEKALPHRKRNSSASWSRDDETSEASELKLHWKPGSYTIIEPTLRDWPPTKSIKKRKAPKPRASNHPKGVERRIANITSDSSTSAFTTSSTTDLVDMHGREVVTIYPSYMEPGRMSPTSRYNERLLHALHKPRGL
ncbi:hypothetical transcript [Echinococcus multilocularis]|uniref:Hypothetical transcript n=1 Tax=Echinococcus multilocularis TaxID=6211 RepID=A0A068XT71_ECHMU|nr:hypothetical transcript [Echinococcus multilocularis]